MVVVHRARGFRFVIYTLDHTPAHIHVTGAGQAKINLLDPMAGLELVYSIGIGRAEMKRLMAEALEHREAFLAEWSVSMDRTSEAEFEAAEDRGRVLLDREARARAAAYDPATGRVTLELVNGCAYVFPAALVQDLQGTSDADLSDLLVDGAGLNLHWPSLDVDLYVPALVSGVFGARTWMSELARRAGRATSPAKAAAARINGAKGGRPRRSA